MVTWEEKGPRSGALPGLFYTFRCLYKPRHSLWERCIAWGENWNRPCRNTPICTRVQQGDVLRSLVPTIRVCPPFERESEVGVLATVGSIFEPWRLQASCAKYSTGGHAPQSTFAVSFSTTEMRIPFKFLISTMGRKAPLDCGGPSRLSLSRRLSSQ